LECQSHALAKFETLECQSRALAKYATLSAKAMCRSMASALQKGETSSWAS
jgi:hypothetical protein